MGKQRRGTSQSAGGEPEQVGVFPKSASEQDDFARGGGCGQQRHGNPRLGPSPREDGGHRGVGGRSGGYEKAPHETSILREKNIEENGAKVGEKEARPRSTKRDNKNEVGGHRRVRNEKERNKRRKDETFGWGGERWVWGSQKDPGSLETNGNFLRTGAPTMNPQRKVMSNDPGEDRQKNERKRGKREGKKRNFQRGRKKSRCTANKNRKKEKKVRSKRGKTAIPERRDRHEGEKKKRPYQNESYRVVQKPLVPKKQSIGKPNKRGHNRKRSSARTKKKKSQKGRKSPKSVY